MKSILNFLISFVIFLPLDALNWTPNPPGEIDNFSVLEKSFVTCAPTPVPGQFMSVYLAPTSTSANAGITGYYSLYNESTGVWSPSTQLNTLSLISNLFGISCTYGNGVTLLAAADPSNKAIFSTYNGSTFSSSLPIAGGGNVSSFLPIVSSVYNSFSKTFLAAWVDVGTLTTPVPYFSETSDNGLTWSPTTAKPIPWVVVPGSLAQVLPPYFNAASTLDKNFMIVWPYVLLNLTRHAYFYLGDTTTPVDGGVVPLVSPASLTSAAFDPNKNQYILTYIDFSSQYPFYAVYDVTTHNWSTPLQIPGSKLADGNITSSLDTNSNTLLFTWVNTSDSSPYYVTYNSSSLGSPWGTPAPIPGGTTTPQGLGTVFPTFDSTTSNFLVTWNDLPGYTSYDSNPIYVTTQSSKLATTTKVTSSPNPSRLFNNVTLQATVTGAGSPTGTVTFYINGVNVGTAPVDPLTGIATLTVPFTTKGTSTVEAIYSGNDTFLGSSGTSTQRVSCCYRIK